MDRYSLRPYFKYIGLFVVVFGFIVVVVVDLSVSAVVVWLSFDDVEFDSFCSSLISSCLPL